MERYTFVRMAVVSIAGLTPFIMAAKAEPAGRRAGSNPDEQAQAKVLELFSASPAVFIENTGQIEDPSVRYYFKGNGANIYHTTGGVVFELFEGDAEAGKRQGTDTLGKDPRINSGAKHSEGRRRTYGVGVRFEGAKVVEPKGAQGQETKVNYYIGNDPNKWRTNVATYAEVVYPGVYKGIDLHAFGRRSHLKYEFHVRPGADYSQIVIRYEGIDGLSIDDEGRLHIETPMGELADDAPFIYQEVGGRKIEIEGRYRLIDKTSYTFEITDGIDAGAELVIDPDLFWGSYLGGSASDYGWGIAVDANGNALITGDTGSTNFPTPMGFDRSYNGGDCDAFVAKVTNSGVLSWASYLGGSGGDYGEGIAVDSGGNGLITGYTVSSNFPTPGGFDRSYAGLDAFVAKVTNLGVLSWGSYLGGSGGDYGEGIAVDSNGCALVTGTTTSTDFPTGGFDASYNGNWDGFVAKVAGDGSELLWASYLGGNNIDYGYDIAVDSGGNALITGIAESNDFPTSGGFDTSLNSGMDAFVAKVTGSGGLAWASYLGGNSNDVGYGIAFDSTGSVMITGATMSTDLATPGGFDTSFNGGYYDAFVAKVEDSGVSCVLSWASYLGGGDQDWGYDIAADSSGDAVITGWTRSYNFPTPKGFDRSYNWGDDAFVAKVSNSGCFVWGTFLGGSGLENGFGVAVDVNGDALITGWTRSTDFPTPGGFDTSYNGGGGASGDAFVAKIDVNGLGTGDLSRDGFVDFEDFARMGGWWMEGCGSPDWCQGSDVDGSGVVDLGDFEAIARQWVEETY